MLCTPVKLDYLVLGFLSFEGIIQALDEVKSLEVFPEEAVADADWLRRLPLRVAVF